MLTFARATLLRFIKIIFISSQYLLKHLKNKINKPGHPYIMFLLTQINGFPFLSFFLNNVSLALSHGCSRLLVRIFIPSEWMRYICINYWFTWAYLCNSELKTLAAYLIEWYNEETGVTYHSNNCQLGGQMPFYLYTWTPANWAVSHSEF